MMQSVTAVVIAHDEPDYFAATLAALKNQSRLPEQVVIVDTSNDDRCEQLAKAAGFEQILKLSPKSNLAKITAAAREVAGESRWLWLLHDDSAPLADALKNLLLATEVSPSVVIAGPKQVEWSDNRVVMQQGLTLTPFGDLFSLVRGELDQGQHDDTDDVLAVGTAGALIRVDAFDQLGGFDHRAPALAADFDFSIRARLAGFRVIVVPTAKIAHAGLSLAGARPRRWLKTSPKAARRRAAIHLRLVYSALPAALLFWLFLPLIGLLRAVWRIIAKRPDRILSEISAALWGFFSLPVRLASRRGKPRQIPFKKLRSLRADWDSVRASARSQLDSEQSRATLEAFANGTLEGTDLKPSPGFVASGGLWIGALLVAVSWAFWPTNVALVGPGAMPLNGSWLELFARAGTSYQEIGFGFYGPSDPFAWVLVLLGALTFWAPSLSIAIVFLLAKAIAFAGAWRFIGLVAESAVVRTLAALAFAFWPAFTVAQLEARVPAVLAITALPWLGLALARVAAIGKVTKSTQQTWSWVAVAGLLFVVVGASAPSTIPVLLISLAVLAGIRIRRFGYLVWVPLPLAAVFGPTILWQLQNLNPLALLADPGLPQATAAVEPWQFLLGGFSYGAELPLIGQVGLWVAAPVVALALAATLSTRWALSSTIWLFALVALSGAWLLSQVEFVASVSGTSQAADGYVAGSPLALIAIFGLCVATLAGVTLDQLNSVVARRWLAGGLVLASFVPALALYTASVPQVSYTDGRVVPSIVAAEAQQGVALKLLVLNPTAHEDGTVSYSAELVSGQGVYFENQSINYRFSLAEQKGEAVDELTGLVGGLVAANNSDLQAGLFDAGIGYILVPPADTAARGDLAISLNSVKELEAVGETDFGGLWRVAEPNTTLKNEPVNESNLWSITKGAQAAVLAAFVLLALPTSTNRRRVAGESSIFVEAGDDN